jgi:hypothetical protein
MKKCPPGVICIENVTIFVLFIIIGFVWYIAYRNMTRSESTTINNEVDISQQPNNSGYSGIFSWLPSYPYNNLPKDVLLNPYAPPYKDERYFVPELSLVPRGAVPINMSTNVSAVDTTYRQLGILTPLNGGSKDNILPLMGRPLFTRRSLWQYYTISNQHNNVKLPVSVKGKSALSEYGVDEIYSGDTVYIEGYNDAFKVTMYDNDTIRYLPAI